MLTCMMSRFQQYFMPQLYLYSSILITSANLSSDVSVSVRNATHLCDFGKADDGMEGGGGGCI